MSVIEKNVVIIGDSCCGKSVLVWNFIHREIKEVTTILSNEYHGEIVVDGHRFRLNLFDTGFACIGDIRDHRAGEYLLSKDFFNAHMILLCFDIRHFDSLESIHVFWMKIIEQRWKKGEIPYILVGLRKDLRHGKEANKEYVPITEEEGKRMAETIKASGYVECSAKNDDGVQEVFETVARIFLKANERKPEGIKGFFKKLFEK